MRKRLLKGFVGKELHDRSKIKEIVRRGRHEPVSEGDARTIRSAAKTLVPDDNLSFCRQARRRIAFEKKSSAGPPLRKPVCAVLKEICPWPGSAFPRY